LKKIIKYVIADILRNRIVLAYLIFLLAISFTVFNLEDNSDKGILTLLHLVLFVVPLMSIVFSTIYIYNSSEFIELLVSQPLRRSRIWLSLFAGLSISLSLAFLIGVGLPVIIYSSAPAGLMMVLMGTILTIVFISIATLAAVLARDKARGIGVSILLWLYFALIFDGLVLFLLFQFQDYPMEKPMVLLSGLNPIDLGRILILLNMNISAMMGFTGAVFRDYFGTNAGAIIASLVLCLWMATPIWLSTRRFSRKDL
jgi:Cu-processing system permease protein